MSPPMHDSIISDLLSLVISAGVPILRQFCDRFVFGQKCWLVDVAELTFAAYFVIMCIARLIPI